MTKRRSDTYPELARSALFNFQVLKSKGVTSYVSPPSSVFKRHLGRALAKLSIYLSFKMKCHTNNRVTVIVYYSPPPPYLMVVTVLSEKVLYIIPKTCAKARLTNLVFTRRLKVTELGWGGSREADSYKTSNIHLFKTVFSFRFLYVQYLFCN